MSITHDTNSEKVVEIIVVAINMAQGVVWGVSTRFLLDAIGKREISSPK